MDPTPETPLARIKVSSPQGPRGVGNGFPLVFLRGQKTNGTKTMIIKLYYTLTPIIPKFLKNR